MTLSPYDPTTGAFGQDVFPLSDVTMPLPFITTHTVVNRSFVENTTSVVSAR